MLNTQIALFIRQRRIGEQRWKNALKALNVMVECVMARWEIFIVALCSVAAARYACVTPRRLRAAPTKVVLIGFSLR